MVNSIAVAHGSTPKGHLSFIGGLGVYRIGGVTGAGAIGQVVTPGKLSTGDVSEGIFWCTKGRRACFHIHIGGKTAINHRRTRLSKLN